MSDRLAACLDAASTSILSVGSGDGSQQASIVERGHRNIVATFFDSKETLITKYPSAAQHLETLKHASHPTLFEIDATKLETYNLGQFDIVMFFFPHTGVPNNDPNNVSSNKALLRGFLQSVVSVVKPSGDVQIALKTGDPYRSWDLLNLLESDFDMFLSSKHSLDKSIFPGYVHRLTLGTSGVLKKVKDDGAQVYVFKHKHQKDQKDSDEPHQAGLPETKGFSVTLIALFSPDKHQWIDEDLHERILEILQSKAKGPQSERESRSGAKKQPVRHMTVLDIRRQFNKPRAAADNVPELQMVEPDPRQLNRCLYRLEQDGRIEKLPPIKGSRCKKPMWKIV